jgi:hypothetical protein
MLPLVQQLASSLAVDLERAPDVVKAELNAYREAEAEAKFDWIDPPRAVVAFVLLEALERIRDYCESALAKKV